MKKIVEKKLKKLEKSEAKLLRKERKRIAALENLKQKVTDKVPDALKNTLTAAFYKGFQVVFEKGTGLIEKTYSRETLEAEHEMRAKLMDGTKPGRAMGDMDKKARGSRTAGSGIAVLEGTILGALGIGLPDIPLFIGVLLKGIYETALHYGFSYDSDVEKSYILRIIRGAVSEGEQRRTYSDELDNMARRLNAGQTPDFDLEKETRETADLLAESMLTAKFIQGIPIVGVVGSITNLSAYRKISTFAGLKYKKRFLERNLAGRHEGSHR